ncbi:Uncharacterized protein Adt_12004 [Abeliophyllum distichum]|uniref:Uncharacterized protein n=1 Tax=Abeliophyllum distichum TaxID=126358 RepID=A0ABD1UPI2_9LAMI
MIEASVVSAMRSTDRDFSIEKATKLGAKVFTGIADPAVAEDEFMKLVQWSSTIAEYQKKFVQLSKYAQVLVGIEIDKCRRFEDGLREEIRSSLTATGWSKFGKLLESALRVGKSMSDRITDKEHIKS